MGSYAGVDYNHTLCPLQIRIQHLYHGKTYARVDFIPQSGTMNSPQLCLLRLIPSPSKRIVCYMMVKPGQTYRLRHLRLPVVIHNIHTYPISIQIHTRTLQNKLFCFIFLCGLFMAIQSNYYSHYQY
jgi:hypothetical protein